MYKSAAKPCRPPGSTTFDPRLAEAFGAAIRDARSKLGLSQEEMANKAGIERSHMGKVERGEHLPNLVMMFKLAKALGLRPAELVELASLHFGD